MITVRVFFEDGAYLTTSINGTLKEVRAYYLGQVFNLGRWHKGDDLQKCVRVEEIKD
jgi:hypothetical protein